MHKHFWGALMAGFIVLSFSECKGIGQDWPQWRGANRDGTTIGFLAPSQWTNAWSRKWQVVVGMGEATPALVGDRLFVFTRQGDTETIQCLRTSDALELWKRQYIAPPVTGAAAPYPGTRSSPAVANGKVITLGVAGLLSCWDADSGKEIWHYDRLTNQVPMFFTSMSPMISDNCCIAHLGGPTNGVVVALDLDSGALKWQTQTECPAYGSPVLMTVASVKQVVLPMAKHIAGFAFEDGKLLWQAPTPPRSGYWNSVTPVINGASVIFSGQGEGTRSIQIEKRADEFAARELWANKEHGAVYATPVLKEGQIIGVSDRGKLYGLDARDGRTLWTGAQRFSYFTSLVDAGSTLWILPEKSGLIAFKPQAGQCEELARIPVSDTPVYAHPIIAGKRIFIKDRETLSMWSQE